MKAIQATLEAAGDQEGEDAQEGLIQQALLRSCSHPALVAGGIFIILYPLLYDSNRTTPVLIQVRGRF